MTQNSPDQAANIIKLKISSNFGDGAIDISGGVVDFQYYESVLSNHITSTIAVMETGFEMDKSGKPKASKGIIDSLPIRGGERVDIRGFGSFYIKKREAREARNPATNQVIKLSERFVPFFKVSKILDELLLTKILDEF